MPAPEIVFDHVYKKFSKGQKFDSLREWVPAMVKGWARGARGDELAEQEFWSVRDVSFQVKPGHVLGIIGHNGAGHRHTLRADPEARTDARLSRSRTGPFVCFPSNYSAGQNAQ